MNTQEASFDLNLLRILVALAATRNVTEAANTLDMSQSGFSSALARLRRLVEDPLFVHTPEGMSPTPRAMAMISAAQEIMSRVASGVLAKPEFNPATARTVFRIAIADATEIVFLPKLLPHLQRVAPHASVITATFEPEPLRRGMASGDIDLALGYFPDLDAPAYLQQPLYPHTYVCMVRKGHPIAQKPITEKSYADYGHVAVASPARSSALLERHLARRGIKRRVVLQTPHHLALPAVVETTELLATVPLGTAVWFAQSGKLDLLRLPFTPPTFVVQQHWHPLMHQDPRSRWLRSQISELFVDESGNWKDLETSLYGPLKRKPQG